MSFSSSLPSTCRTWQYTKTSGGIEKHIQLNASASLPKPNASKQQHLIRVVAAALNPVDYKLVENVPGVKRFAAPGAATPGLDFAGIVVKPAEGSGERVTVKVGDVVFGIAGRGDPVAGGALSEYAVSGAMNCVPVPEGVDAVDAATIGVAGLTAYQSIVPYVKSGDSVFINGGSGGTGCFGIQIAKALGCSVTTSCSGRNVELCRGLGADEVVDYTEGKLWDQLEKKGVMFDHVVDNVGSDSQLYFKCHRFSKPEAWFVMVGGSPSLGMMFGTLEKKFRPGVLGGGRRKYTGFFPHPETNDLTQIGAWMREGKVKAVIDERFKFEDVPKAFDRLKTGRARGKIVVDVSKS